MYIDNTNFMRLSAFRRQPFYNIGNSFRMFQTDQEHVDKPEFICYYNEVKLIRQFVCTILSLNKTRTNYQNMNSKLQLDYFRDNFAHWHGYKVSVLFLYRKLLWNSIYSKNRRTLCFNLNQKDTRTGDMNYVHFKNRSKF